MLSLEKKMKEVPGEEVETHVTKQNLHYVMAILFAVTASCLWGVHNLTMKYLITQEHIQPREYSFVSTFIDGALGSIFGAYYLFNEIAEYDLDGNKVEFDPTQFRIDSWVMLIAGFLGGIAILIGLLAVSLGNLGTT